MSILRDRIRDNRFLRLIENLLQAGYLEDWAYHATYSGSPQGGVLSPILANIYLDRLDAFIEGTLLPEFTRGAARKRNPEYEKAYHRSKYLMRTDRGDSEEAKRLRELSFTLPSRQPNDPDYRRLRYLRYADDFLLGFAGPKSEAEEIKRRLSQFLRDHLKLELSENKTLVSHARTMPARFLGYDILVQHNDTYRCKDSKRLNGHIGLYVPSEVVRARCQRYMLGGKATDRPNLLRESTYSILMRYQAEYRGFANYYQLACDRSKKLRKLKWITEKSLTLTLANKFRTTVPRIYKRFGAIQKTPDGGSYKVLQVKVEREGRPPLTATWGGISLARPPRSGPSSLNDLNDNDRVIHARRSEILVRLLNNTCELCGSQENIQVHHIRHMRDLKRPGRKPKPWWIQHMARMRRKTLVVCQNCHCRIHKGEVDGSQSGSVKDIESCRIASKSGDSGAQTLTKPSFPDSLLLESRMT